MMNTHQMMLVAGTAAAIIIIIGGAIYYSGKDDGDGSDTVKVVATFYPLAYFSKEIGGEYVDVASLVPYNTEIHSWQPSAMDIVAADKADILVYNGGGADHWFERDILPVLGSRERIVVNTTEDMELLTVEYEGHEIVDPHTWICPFTAEQQAEKIYRALVKKDGAHEAYYTHRWESLREAFEKMDQSYAEGLQNTRKDTIFVTHTAFGYLAHRYGFAQYGVIGLSADEQPSTSTIKKLVDMMIEYDTYVIYVDPIYSSEYAQTLKNTLEEKTGRDVTILVLYLMLGPVDDMDYFDQQEKNLENLIQGLEAP